MDLNLLVRDMNELLHRTLGENIELEGVLAPRLWVTEIDPNQLQNAMLNLAVNARDAMPEGGKLTIETMNTALDESYVATDAEVIAGQYVMLSVSDNGSGMSKATLTKAFEPFYTTKGVGKGTGLGLSMVYGFVKQSGGHVTIYSEEGQGTTVKLYFPRCHKVTIGADAAPPVPASGSGEETILVVEDNEEVRAYSVMIFRELGYRVLEAPDSTSALTILKVDQRIDLLFTDVVLPDGNGRILAETALSHRPELPVLFTTGYSRNAIVHHGRLDAVSTAAAAAAAAAAEAAAAAAAADTTRRNYEPWVSLCWSWWSAIPNSKSSCHAGTSGRIARRQPHLSIARRRGRRQRRHDDLLRAKPAGRSEARQLDPDRAGQRMVYDLRLYSPLEPFFTKEWRLSEIELVR